MFSDGKWQLLSQFKGWVETEPSAHFKHDLHGSGKNKWLDLCNRSYFVAVVVVAVSQGVAVDVANRLHQHLQHVSTPEHQLVDGSNLL